MKLLVIARSDCASFIGMTPEDGYTVSTLDDSVDITIGDILSHPTWDDFHGLFVEVKNLTEDDTVNICIENWHMNLQGATELLSRLGEPKQILWLRPWPDSEVPRNNWSDLERPSRSGEFYS